MADLDLAEAIRVIASEENISILDTKYYPYNPANAGFDNNTKSLDPNLLAALVAINPSLTPLLGLAPISNPLAVPNLRTQPSIPANLDLNLLANLMNTIRPVSMETAAAKTTQDQLNLINLLGKLTNQGSSNPIVPSLLFQYSQPAIQSSLFGVNPQLQISSNQLPTRPITQNISTLPNPSQTLAGFSGTSPANINFSSPTGTDTYSYNPLKSALSPQVQPSNNSYTLSGLINGSSNLSQTGFSSSTSQNIQSSSGPVPFGSNFIPLTSNTTSTSNLRSNQISPSSNGTTYNNNIESTFTNQYKQQSTPFNTIPGLNLFQLDTTNQSQY